MKAYYTKGYNFQPNTGSQRIIFTDPTFDIRRLIAIIDVTANLLIYAPGVTGKGGTYTVTADPSGDSRVLTFQYDTTSACTSGDALQILYDTSSDTIGNYGDVPVNVRSMPQRKFRTSFVKALSGTVDSDFWQTGSGTGINGQNTIGIKTGAGMTINQTGGNLVITSGTTANDETLIRSVESFSESFVLKWQSILSQRIANNNFMVELVDVVGDGLTWTSTATALSVRFPENSYNMAMVSSSTIGQAMNIGLFTGTAGTIPGRYVVSSTFGGYVGAPYHQLTFTVAGFPASGSGNCSVWGRSYHQAIYTGTTATALNFDSQRSGYASGATTAAINTTASPGHVAHIQQEDGVVTLLDQLVASSTGVQTTVRASRVANAPDTRVPLFLQIRVQNGTTAPASSTTWTVGFVSVENYTSMPVQLMSTRAGGTGTPLPVTIPGTVTTSTTLTANTPTLAAGTSLAGDVGQQYRASATGAATPFKQIAAASTNAASVKASGGKIVGWSISNTQTTGWIFAKLYNKATAPTVGTDAPVLTIAVGPGQTSSMNQEGGISFATGIALAVTGAASDADTTAVTAAASVVNLAYV